MVSMQYIMIVGGRVWIQTDPQLVLQFALQSLEKFKYLVSILNRPWLLVTPSLYVHSLKTVQFVFWEGNSKWTCWFMLCRPPIAQRYEIAALVYIWKWVAIFDCPFVNVIITNLAVIDSEHLCANSPPFLTISPSWYVVEKGYRTWFWYICLCH